MNAVGNDVKRDFEHEILAALQAAGHGFTGVRKLQRLSAGASQETWLFEAVGEAQPTPLILRRGEAGHQQPREGTIDLQAQSQLADLVREYGVPTPATIAWLGADCALQPGYIMEYVAGETLPRRILREARFKGARERMAQQCGNFLGRLHNVPKSGLSMLPRMSIEEQVRRLRSQYLRQDHPRPVFELAFQWLRRNILPEPKCCALVHGDFRNGNLMVDEGGVVAVLDWERAFIGDPMYDLAWLQLGSWRFGQIDKPVGGFGELTDLYSAYQDAAGSAPDPARVRFWEVFGSLDWGVTTITFAQESVADTKSVERAAVGRRASEAEIDLLCVIAAEEERND